MKIRNLNLKGQSLYVGGMTLSFNNEGIAEATEEAVTALKGLNGYELIEEEKVPNKASQQGQAEDKADDKGDIAEDEGLIDIDALVEESDYQDSNMAELKEMLEERNIEFDSRSKKDDLVRLLVKDDLEG